MHFSHDSLIVIMHIGSCRVFRILIDNGCSVNILYGSVLNRMEDTSEIARTMMSLDPVKFVWI